MPTLYPILTQIYQATISQLNNHSLYSEEEFSQLIDQQINYFNPTPLSDRQNFILLLLTYFKYPDNDNVNIQFKTNPFGESSFPYYYKMIWSNYYKKMSVFINQSIQENDDIIKLLYIFIYLSSYRTECTRSISNITIKFPDYQIGYLYSLLPFYKLNTGISQSLKRMIVEIKVTLSELCIDEEVRSKMFKSNLASLAYKYIYYNYCNSNFVVEYSNTFSNDNYYLAAFIKNELDNREMNEGGYKLLSTAINNILFFVKVLYIYILIVIVKL